MKKVYFCKYYFFNAIFATLLLIYIFIVQVYNFEFPPNLCPSYCFLLYINICHSLETQTIRENPTHFFSVCVNMSWRNLLKCLASTYILATYLWYNCWTFFLAVARRESWIYKVTKTQIGIHNLLTLCLLRGLVFYIFHTYENISLLFWTMLLLWPSSMNFFVPRFIIKFRQSCKRQLAEHSLYIIYTSFGFCKFICTFRVYGNRIPKSRSYYLLLTYMYMW